MIKTSLKIYFVTHLSPKFKKLHDLSDNKWLSLGIKLKYREI